MEAERRRFEAEVLAAAAVKAAAPRSALRSLTLVTVLLLAGAAGYVHLENRAALAQRDAEVQAALRGERAEAARGASAQARITRLEKDRAQLVAENARLSARLHDVAPAAWNADLPLGPTLLVLPAEKVAPARIAPPPPAPARSRPRCRPSRRWPRPSPSWRPPRSWRRPSRPPRSRRSPRAAAPRRRPRRPSAPRPSR
jgi:hypothetical protein